MTAPMSLGDVARGSATASSIARAMSSGEAALGRYSWMTFASRSSFWARSSRPAARNCSAASLRCLMSVPRTRRASSSARLPGTSVSRSFSAVFTMRSAPSRSASRALRASTRSLSIRCPMVMEASRHYSTWPRGATPLVLQLRQRRADARPAPVGRRVARAVGSRRGGRVERRDSMAPSAPVAVDRSYVDENAAELRRLRALIERMSDADLARPTPGGWTVAASLAHVAFWDQRILFWLDRWEDGQTPRRLVEADVDWINDASKPLCLGLTPRVAARLAVETAEQLDRRLAGLTDERIAQNRAAGEPLFLIRGHHRKTHLDEIEQVLG